MNYIDYEDDKKPNRVTAILSCNRALLGAISNPILRIYIKIYPFSLQLIILVNEPLAKDELEVIDIACTEIIADFGPKINVWFDIIEQANCAMTDMISNDVICIFERYDGYLKKDYE